MQGFIKHNMPLKGGDNLLDEQGKVNNCVLCTLFLFNCFLYDCK